VNKTIIEMCESLGLELACPNIKECPPERFTSSFHYCGKCWLNNATVEEIIKQYKESCEYNG